MVLYPGLLISTKRKFESAAASEIHYTLINKLGLSKESFKARNSGISGLITVFIENQDLIQIINELRALESDNSYFVHCLKFKPIQYTTKLDINFESLKTIVESKILNNDTESKYKIQIEKRHSKIRSTDLIANLAQIIPNPVDLTNPTWILLVELIGDEVGVSRIDPDIIFSTNLAYQQDTDQHENWFLE